MTKKKGHVGRGRPRLMSRREERYLRQICSPDSARGTLHNAYFGARALRFLQTENWREQKKRWNWLLRIKTPGAYAAAAIRRARRQAAREALGAVGAFGIDEEVIPMARDTVDETDLAPIYHPRASLLYELGREPNSICLQVFADALCAIRPRATEGIRLIRDWRRRLKDLAGDRTDKASLISAAEQACEIRSRRPTTPSEARR
jgi:hypothetical protein